MSSSEKILLTGASGFVGGALVKALSAYPLVTTGRRASDANAVFSDRALRPN